MQENGITTCAMERGLKSIGTDLGTMGVGRQGSATAMGFSLSPSKERNFWQHSKYFRMAPNHRRPIPCALYTAARFVPPTRHLTFSQWANDMREGYGTYYYENGEQYEGDWKRLAGTLAPSLTWLH